jgi:hypothetical protein
MNSQRMAEAAIRRLHKLVPELPARRGVLIVPPTEHLLRCFVLETNVGKKGKAYFWRVVMPLYRPRRFLLLNYGERILGGELLDLAETELDRSLRRMLEAISQGERNYLSSFRGPREFLEKIDWDRLPQSPNYRLDRALSHYLSGDASACLGILEEVASAKVRPIWNELVQLAAEIVQEMKTTPSALDKRIQAWEAGNRALLL